MAFDGTNFWIGDYSGTNKAYYYSPGNLNQDVTLSKARFYDGLEFFNGNLIANEFDGFGGTNTITDVYDTDGNLLTAGFIKTPNRPASTGIAFDGTNFWIAGVSDGKLYEYNGTTGAFISSVTVNPVGHSFEDLSVDYNIVIPPSNGVPEPGTWITLSGGLLALGLLRIQILSTTQDLCQFRKYVRYSVSRCFGTNPASRIMRRSSSSVAR